MTENQYLYQIFTCFFLIKIVFLAYTKLNRYKKNNKYEMSIIHRNSNRNDYFPNRANSI